jgi:hypothetical protein
MLVPVLLHDVGIEMGWGDSVIRFPRMRGSNAYRSALYPDRSSRVFTQNFQTQLIAVNQTT